MILHKYIDEILQSLHIFDGRMRFIESILLKDGEYHNLNYHQDRVDRVFTKLAPDNTSHDLKLILPKLELPGTYKVRLVYGVEAINAPYDVEYAEYYPRKIESLQVMHSDPFDYSLKYENRDVINTLVSKSSLDDIIIAIDNLVTDGSYFNLAFWDGTHWYTPDSPLLKGVRRTQLIEDRRIKERTIYVSDIASFQKVSLINAMLDLGQLEIPTHQITI